MSSYKEINKLPFRDFTLSEFDKWRSILGHSKDNKFANIKFPEMMQIVYYLIAIRHYGGATFFLDKCKPKNIQVRFLKVLLFFGEKPKQINRSNDDSHIDVHRLELLELANIKYMPALLLVCKIKRGLIYYSKNRENTLDKLTQIFNSMTEKRFDDYLIQSLSYMIIHNEQRPEGFPKKMPLIDQIEMILNGFDKPLLKLFHACLNRSNRDGMFFVANYNNVDAEKLGALLPKIKNIIFDKILKPNYEFIIKLLNILKKHTFNLRHKPLFDQQTIMIACLKTIYDYLIKGGDNASIGLAYLDFLATIDTNLTKMFDPICKRLLLKYYFNGLIYLPPHVKNRDAYYLHLDVTVHLGNLHKKWKITQEDNRILDLSVPAIVDLVENWFWLEELYNKPDKIKHEDRYIENRVNVYDFLLNISNLLWKPALCVFGINLLNIERSFSREIVDTYKKSENIRMIIERNLWRSDLLRMRDYAVFVMDQTIKEMVILRSKYVATFENLPNSDEFKSLRSDCQKFKLKIKRDYGPINPFIKVILNLAELHVFSFRYTEDLNLHEKFKYGGREYLKVKDNFDKRSSLQNPNVINV